MRPSRTRASCSGLGVEVLYGDVNLPASCRRSGPELSLAILVPPARPPPLARSVRELAPARAVVYDTVDLHWLREARRRRRQRSAAARVKASALRELELALIRACDATLVVTAEERDRVTGRCAGGRGRVVPNVNPIRARRAAGTGRAVSCSSAASSTRRTRRRAPPGARGDAARVARVGRMPVTIVGGSLRPEVEASPRLRSRSPDGSRTSTPCSTRARVDGRAAD